MAAGREDRGCRRTAIAPAEMVAMARCSSLSERERQGTQLGKGQGRGRKDRLRAQRKNRSAVWSADRGAGTGSSVPLLTFRPPHALPPLPSRPLALFPSPTRPCPLAPARPRPLPCACSHGMTATWRLAPGRCTAERTVVAGDAWAHDDDAVAAALAAAAADPTARVLTYTSTASPPSPSPSPLRPPPALANAGFVRMRRPAMPGAPPPPLPASWTDAGGPSTVCYGRILAVPSTRLYGGQTSAPSWSKAHG